MEFRLSTTGSTGASAARRTRRRRTARAPWRHEGLRARVGCAARECVEVGRDCKPLRSKKRTNERYLSSLQSCDCSLFGTRDERPDEASRMSRNGCDTRKFQGGRVIDWAQRPAHVAHAESSRDPKVRVELRGPLSYRARLSLANATSAPSGTHGPTDSGADPHGTRSTHPAAWIGGRVVISRTETSAKPARAASDRRPTPRSPSRVTRHDRLHHG